MQAPPLMPGFIAVAVACGVVLFALTSWNQSGIGISVWLGFITTLVVGAALAVLLVLLNFLPIAASAFAVAGRSLVTSIALWVTVSVTVLFLANAVTDPAHILDFGFFVPMGALYGSVSGTAFWKFSGLSAL